MDHGNRTERPEPEDLETDDRFVSGPWHGFYIQGGQRGRQSMDLTFRAGAVLGQGADPGGSFRVEGTYDVERGRAWLRKTYSTHVVEYDGHAEGDGIWGKWEIRYALDVDRGGFHIWPEAFGEGMGKALAAAEPEAVGLVEAGQRAGRSR